MDTDANNDQLPGKHPAMSTTAMNSEKITGSGSSSDTASSDAVAAPDEKQSPASNDSNDDGDMSTTRVLVVWFAIALSNLCVFLDEGIIATAIPRITDQFHSLADVGWYGSAYNITLCSFQLVFGRLFTEYPIKHVFLAALAIFEVGSLVCALAPSSAAFAVGRAVAGLGAAGLSSGNLVLLSASLPLKKLPQYLGALGMVYGVGAVVGPVLGGIITNSYLTWRWCFWINLPVAAPTALATILLIKVRPQPRPNADQSWVARLRSLDPLGIALLLPAIVSFILALQYGGSLATWQDGRTVVCFVVSGVLMLLFAVEQWWMGDRALVPPRLLRTRVLLFSAGFAFCLDSGFYTLVYYLPLWFQAIQGVSPETSGIRYLSMVIALVVTVFLGGFGVTKLGYYQPFMLAGTILLSVGAGLLSTLTPSSGISRWLPYQVVAGLGIGLSTQMPAIAVQSTLGEADVNIAIAVVLFAQCFGPTVFITVAQAVFSSTLGAGLADSFPGLDLGVVLRDSGATQLRALVPPEKLDLLLEVYNHALTRTYVVAAGMAAATVFSVVGIGWRRVPQGGDGGGAGDGEGDKALAAKEPPVV